MPVLGAMSLATPLPEAIASVGPVHFFLYVCCAGTVMRSGTAQHDCFSPPFLSRSALNNPLLSGTLSDTIRRCIIPSTQEMSFCELLAEKRPSPKCPHRFRKHLVSLLPQIPTNLHLADNPSLAKGCKSRKSGPMR